MNLVAIVKHAIEQQNSLRDYERLTDIYSGNLVEYVKQEMAKELSGAAYRVASERIASINMIERITNKLSKVYSDTPARATLDNSDNLIIEEYANKADIQSVMAQAEILLNINKHFALEPYENNGTINVRVLAPYEFTVFSDNEKNPKAITAFIKYMGSTEKGKRSANVYWVYTDVEFIIVDSDFEIHEQRKNPYGTIPFVYCNSNIFTLQPKPDNDLYNNAILIPKLLTDLNYAVQFQSHSVMYGIDVDVSNLKANPDSFWDIKSAEGEGKKPQLGMLNPTVDVDKVLSLVTFTTSEWLTSKGIKPGSVGNLTADNAASGISKIVDEADASQAIAKNRITLSKAEKSLWNLIGKIHNTLLSSDVLDIKKGLSNNLDVSITFPLQKPIQDPKEKREELKFKLENKLTSYFRAVKESNPTLSNEEIDKLIQEIKAESSQEPKPEPNAQLKQEPTNDNLGE